MRQNEIQDIVRSPDFVRESQVVFTPGRNKNRALIYDCDIECDINEILRGICLTEFDVFFKSYRYYFCHQKFIFTVFYFFLFSLCGLTTKLIHLSHL